MDDMTLLANSKKELQKLILLAEFFAHYKLQIFVKKSVYAYFTKENMEYSSIIIPKTVIKSGLNEPLPNKHKKDYFKFLDFWLNMELNWILQYNNLLFTLEQRKIKILEKKLPLSVIANLVHSDIGGILNYYFQIIDINNKLIDAINKIISNYF